MITEMCFDTADFEFKLPVTKASFESQMREFINNLDYHPDEDEITEDEIRDLYSFCDVKEVYITDDNGRAIDQFFVYDSSLIDKLNS